MADNLCLNDINLGECAVVKKIGPKCAIRRRLMDIGVVRNTKIECVGESPLGDPRAYLIKGAVIAIRSADCADIAVESAGECNGHN